MNPEMFRRLMSTPLGQLLKPWGDGVTVVQPDFNWSEDDGPPEDGNGWGRSEIVQPGSNSGGATTFIEFAVKKSRAFTIAANIDTPLAPTTTNAAGATISIYLWLKVDWGNGSASATKNYRIASHIDASASGNFIKVSAFIGDINGVEILASQLLPGLSPLPSCRVSVF